MLKTGIFYDVAHAKTYCRSLVNSGVIKDFKIGEKYIYLYGRDVGCILTIYGGRYFSPYDADKLSEFSRDSLVGLTDSEYGKSPLLSIKIDTDERSKSLVRYLISNCCNVTSCQAGIIDDTKAVNIISRVVVIQAPIMMEDMTRARVDYLKQNGVEIEDGRDPDDLKVGWMMRNNAWTVSSSRGIEFITSFIKYVFESPLYNKSVKKV